MKNKNILLGITGGIAAYKSAFIASGLSKLGYNVTVIMSKNAEEFITPLTLETLTYNKVVTDKDLFARPDKIDVEHISLAQKADLVIIAPATYNIVGKVANGIADDMLSTVISATKAPVYFALAMNTNMYENPILQENINKLKKLGYEFIDADTGRLAFKSENPGKGRMKEPEEIIKIIHDAMTGKKTLSGKKVLISAGRTEEPVDPVRYLSNGSTGKMGYALAEKARELGAEVTLVSGPASAKEPYGVRIINVRTALEMKEAMENEFAGKDIVIMSAAVADYRPIEYSEDKIKKNEAEMILRLVKNPDILEGLGKIKENQFLVGFAAESRDIINYAKDKLARKNLDMIVANHSSNIGSDNNEVFIIDFSGNIITKDKKPKSELAYDILDEIIKNLEKRDKK